MRLLIIFSAFSIIINGCAVVHNYDGYQGKVIDVDTKEPLEGAAVLAVFNTEEYGPAGSVSHYVDAQETVTDKNGEFKIPSFIASAFRPMQLFEPYGWFTIFKPGYGCYPNHKGIRPEKLRNGILPVNKYVIIELPKLKTREERIESTHCSPDSEIPYNKCKKFIDLLNQENVDLGFKIEYRD